jgi:hypothetical protein
MKHIFLNVMGTVSVFSGSNDIIEYMVENIEARQYQPEDYIVK